MKFVIQASTFHYEIFNETRGLLNRLSEWTHYGIHNALKIPK
jgi:hypothetical protein